MNTLEIVEALSVDKGYIALVEEFVKTHPRLISDNPNSAIADLPDNVGKVQLGMIVGYATAMGRFLAPGNAPMAVLTAVLTDVHAADIACNVLNGSLRDSILDDADPLSRLGAEIDEFLKNASGE